MKVSCISSSEQSISMANFKYSREPVRIVVHDPNCIACTTPAKVFSVHEVRSLRKNTTSWNKSSLSRPRPFQTKKVALFRAFEFRRFHLQRARVVSREYVLVRESRCVICVTSVRAGCHLSKTSSTGARTARARALRLALKGREQSNAACSKSISCEKVNGVDEVLSSRGS